MSTAEGLELSVEGIYHSTLGFREIKKIKKKEKRAEDGRGLISRLSRAEGLKKSRAGASFVEGGGREGGARGAGRRCRCRQGPSASERETEGGKGRERERDRERG